MSKLKIIFYILFCFYTILIAQNYIDIAVKGISDNKKDGAQKDRLEAIMDAKRQACEKAGLKIEAKTTVENFQTVYDYVDSQAEAVLLPGFQVIDIGYVADGTYQVVLNGKLLTSNKETKKGTTKLTFFLSAYYREKVTENNIMKKMEGILNDYPIDINKKPIQMFENTVSIKYHTDLVDKYLIIAVTYEVPAELFECRTYKKLLQKNKEYYSIYAPNMFGTNMVLSSIGELKANEPNELDLKTFGYNGGKKIKYPEQFIKIRRQH